jgi:hypothetical protein
MPSGTTSGRLTSPLAASVQHVDVALGQLDVGVEQQLAALGVDGPGQQHARLQGARVNQPHRQA